MNSIITAKRSPWPYGIVLFFIMLALFDTFIIIRALQTKTGTVTERPYEEGLLYERKIAARIAANQAGLKAVYKLGNHPALVIIQGLKSNVQKTFQLKLIKPDDPSLDRQFSINSFTNEFVLGEINLKPGLWMVELIVSVDGTEFYFESKEII